MTDPKIGDQFHFTRTGIQFQVEVGGRLQSVMSRRGQSLTIDHSMLSDELRDRNGNSWVQLIHDPGAQVARWGEVAIVPGPAPEGLSAWTPGTAEEDDARAEARAAAYAISDPAEQQTALAMVYRDFGRPATSRTFREHKEPGDARS